MKPIAGFPHFDHRMASVTGGFVSAVFSSICCIDPSRGSGRSEHFLSHYAGFCLDAPACVPAGASKFDSFAGDAVGIFIVRD